MPQDVSLTCHGGWNFLHDIKIGVLIMLFLIAVGLFFVVAHLNRIGNSNKEILHELQKINKGN